MYPMFLAPVGRENCPDSKDKWRGTVKSCSQRFFAKKSTMCFMASSTSRCTSGTFKSPRQHQPCCMSGKVMLAPPFLAMEAAMAPPSFFEILRVVPSWHQKHGHLDLVHHRLLISTESSFQSSRRMWSNTAFQRNAFRGRFAESPNTPAESNGTDALATCILQVLHAGLNIFANLVFPLEAGNPCHDVLLACCSVTIEGI
eukprot:Skav211005  [mRNA]  locus=scaffold1610:123250:131687:- [translate_table: standard]